MSTLPNSTVTSTTEVPPVTNTDVVASAKVAEAVSQECLGAYIDGLRILASALTLPSEQTAQGWEDGSFPEAMREIATVLQGGIRTPSSTQSQLEDALQTCMSTPCTLDALRRDYTRLFTHPKRALIPIYESHFRAVQEGKSADEMPLLVVNRTAEAADNAYRAAGFKHAAGSMISGDRMDIELTFLALLLERGDFETARTFVADHLQPWAPAFFDAIATNAQTSQYQIISLFGKIIFCYN